MKKPDDQRQAAGTARLTRCASTDPCPPSDPWDIYESNTNAAAFEMSLKLYRRKSCATVNGARRILNRQHLCQAAYSNVYPMFDSLTLW